MMRSLFSENSTPDHYATLGLDRRCTPAQIRSAYRLLSKRHHPDLNGGSADAVHRTQQLNAAYEVLSDPSRRRAYDQELSASTERPAGPRSPLERDVRQDLHLRIDELLGGAHIEVKVTDPGNPAGPECYPLEIPEETAPGTRLRIARGAPYDGGSVILRVKVRPHPRLKVRGSDLQTELRISTQRAASGGMEVVAGADGRPVKVAIPAGLARGTIVVIPRGGLPKARGGRGDLRVRVTYRPEVRFSRRS